MCSPASPLLTCLEPLYCSTKTGVIFGKVSSISTLPVGILPPGVTCTVPADTSCTGGPAADQLDDDESNMLDAAGSIGYSAVSAAAVPYIHGVDFRLVSISLALDDDDDDDADDQSASTTISLLWAPSISPAVDCPFLMQCSHYNASIALDTRPGTSVRSMFAVSITCVLSAFFCVVTASTV